MTLKTIDGFETLSQNTRASYGRVWRAFLGFCDVNKLQPTPANTKAIVGFLETLKTSKRNTILLAVSALKTIYRLNGQQTALKQPQIENKIASVLKTAIANQSLKQAKPLDAKQVSLMISNQPKTLIGLRNACLLAVGFGAALRRSEIVSLMIEDIEFVAKNQMLILIRKSKTDQWGVGSKIPVVDGSKIKPVLTTKKWLRASKLKTGPLIRNLNKQIAFDSPPLRAGRVNALIKKFARDLGLDEKNYSSHSLRAGFITSAAKANARLDKIMEISRHRSLKNLMGYVRDGSQFENHAGSSFL